MLKHVLEAKRGNTKVNIAFKEIASIDFIIQQLTITLAGSDEKIYIDITEKDFCQLLKIWEEYFSTNMETSKVIPYFWLPKWCGDIKEPSARVLQVYKKDGVIEEL